MSTADACVFGGAPKAVDAPEKIFAFVESCVCVSSPITTSHPPATTPLLSGPFERRRAAPRRSLRPLGGQRACISRVRGRSSMPVGHLLILMRDVEQLRFAEIVALDLQTDRQTAPIEAAGNRDGGRAGQVAGDGEDVVQIHLYRVVGLGADLERGRGRRRAYGDGAFSVRALAVVGDQPADLLRLQVVRVVVAVRKNIGAHEDASLHFGTKAFRARFL